MGAILKKTEINVSIIIINYNLSDEIKECLDSLLNVLKNQNVLTYEIIVIDNNSPDRKLYEISSKFKDENVKFYYLDKNLGFGQGNNFGFSKASGEFICFLNPDTLVQNEIFSTIIKLFESDKSIGIIGPNQQTRAPFFDFSAGFSPNIFFELLNLFGIGVFVEGAFMYLYSRIKSQKYFQVNWILGAAIFIKAELYKDIGGFDKDYFMFFEEVDLCKRVLNKEYKVIYNPTLKIHHIGSVSSKKNYKLYTIRTYSSKYIYFTKHFNSLLKSYMIILLYGQIISQILIWTFLFPKNPNKSKQKLSAFFHLLKNRMKYEHRD